MLTCTFWLETSVHGKNIFSDDNYYIIYKCSQGEYIESEYVIVNSID